MKYSLVKDKDGVPIHTSPPWAPWCPAIYQSQDGAFIFVGEILGPQEASSEGINVNAVEAAIKVSKDHLKRLIDAYLAGTLHIEI